MPSMPASLPASLPPSTPRAPVEPAAPARTESQVFVNPKDEQIIARLHSTITNQPPDSHFQQFESYLGSHDPAKPAALPLSVCFKNLTTYGHPGAARPVKTVKDAIWRTLTFRDIYEWVVEPIIHPVKQQGVPIIKDFSGVVRTGQIMLVLGNPGSGCSTFLRTIGNDHASYLDVKGSISYSGLSPQDISRNYRGSVSYIPEDDVHLPTLTVRQTLEFALRNRTPKKYADGIPRFLDEFGRIFGMTHVANTLVGNEFIRGVSGGERKRVSILESLSTDSSVSAWDGSTRGLDASSALDFMKSLRIMTDACERATIVSIYQASDAIYNLADTLLLIDEGRMLYQGPANRAEEYFNNIGYRRLPRQTMSDFLTSVASSDPSNIMTGWELRAPRGAENMEAVFRSSSAFKDLEIAIDQYQDDFAKVNHDKHEKRQIAAQPHHNLFRFVHGNQDLTSKFVSSKSSYRVSFFRQLQMCVRREMWQLKGHLSPLYSKLFCALVSAFILGSMFYQMPDNTDGVYSRGGFYFYSAALVAWFQMAELESAFFDRDIVSRQRRYAIVRPSAVALAKAVMDIPLALIQCSILSIIAYFLAGARSDAASFFAYLGSMTLCTLSFTTMYRCFGAGSRSLEIALRYCGLLLVTCMIFGGYTRSAERLIADVPWVGWMTYITPVVFTFEIMLSMEFHNRVFPCTPTSFIPNGDGYTDRQFQSCSAAGVTAGSSALDGDAYILSQFGFRYSNIGFNFGILLIFMFGYLALNMWLVEVVDWVQGGANAPEYANKKLLAKQKHRPTQPLDGGESNSSGAVGTGLDSKTSSDDGTTSATNSDIFKTKSTFVWKDLVYKVPYHSEQKTLLNSVSGFCEPGKLTALVGSSGAGKSTLMTVLTQQSPKGTTLTGSMMVDGQEVGASFGRNIGYCQQMDIHVGTSTVREAFEFSALLRQESTVPKAQKLAYVDNVIDLLGMSSLQHAVIKSLSMEQKKRTTIGVELCAKPSTLLFLDEPTSGLDSQGAMRIVHLLRKLSDAGQSIICTIHQASQEQFEIFDRVLALAPGGSCYYFGDIGKNGSTVLDYFSHNGLHAKAGKNVADLLIEATAKNRDRDWCQIWRDSPENQAVQDKVAALSNTRAISGGDDTDNPAGGKTAKSSSSAAAPDNSYYASSTLEQIHHLTKRTLVQYWRTPDYIYSRLFCSLMHALLNGLAFLQLGNSVADLQYRIFSCFLVLMIVPEFINACAMMFEENRNIWLGREHPSRIYGWVAFSSAQIIAEIPYALAGAVIFYVVFYFLVGLPLGTPAGYTFLMMVAFHLFSTSWGQWIAAFSSDAVMAASIMPFFVLMCEFFNGVVQPRDLMPPVWRYTMYYLGPFTYWISGIVAMILPGLAVQCKDSELVRFEPPAGATCGSYAEDWLATTMGVLVNPSDTSFCGYCKYEDGSEYLSSLKVEASDAWRDLGIFFLFTVVNYGFVYLMVYVKSVRKWLPW